MASQTSTRADFTATELETFDRFIADLTIGNIHKGKTADVIHEVWRTSYRGLWIKRQTGYETTTPTVRAWDTKLVFAFCKDHMLVPVMMGRSKWLERRMRNAMGDAQAKLNDERLVKPQPVAQQPAPSAPAASVDMDEVRRVASRAATENIAAKLEAGLEKIDSAVRVGIRKEMDDAIEQMMARAEQARPLQIVDAKGITKAVAGHTHQAFEKVLKLAAARVNVLLIGPAGSGKSHMAQQVADALELDFFFINCSEGMSESKLEGYLAPTGKAGRFEFITTDFIRAYENGGVFLLDEVDACDPNVLLVINAALANGHLALPKRYDNPVATRHEDFVLIASANTYGTGANRMYVGRNQLDEATLDRFRMGQIEMDFDAALEAQLVADDEVRNAWQRVRAAVNTYKLRRVISTRTMVEAATKLKAAGFTLPEMLGQLTMGWSDDELSRVGLRKDRTWA